LRKIVIVILIVIAFFSGIIYWAFYDTNRLPAGDMITEVVSPNGDYTLKAYRVNGGATVSYSIRGELNYNASNKKPKNIYWNYREDEAKVEWIDDNTVVINGHSLNVLKDVYDWRREN
jgi:hypothetical protein